MTLPARRPLLLGPSMAAGGILLTLAGCTIGMDDRPVPPEAIPGVAADVSEPATYGAPAQDYSVIQAAPAVASAPVAAPDEFPPAPEGEMVWQAGPKPAVEASDLPPVETHNADAPAAPQETQAEAGAPAQAENEAAEPAGEPERVAVSRDGGFRVAPFVGIGAEAGRPLLTALVGQAQARGIALDGAAGAMVLKTYLSSYPDGGETVLTYVFDIYDADGTRLTRIDGQEKLPGSTAGWQGAPPELVKSVAKKAMRRLEAWKDGAEA